MKKAFFKLLALTFALVVTTPALAGHTRMPSGNVLQTPLPARIALSWQDGFFPAWLCIQCGEQFRDYTAEKRGYQSINQYALQSVVG